jgi:uncharacterized protein involved in type VI secretion and phage assembly
MTDEATLYGVHEATVLDVRDPEGLGRVRVRPSSLRLSGVEKAWSRLATLMAGNDRGTWFVPDVGDEVLVAFEAGDPRRPYVVGALWSSTAPPPETMDGAGDNPRRVIATRGGARIAIDDAAGRARRRARELDRARAGRHLCHRFGEGADHGVDDRAHGWDVDGRRERGAIRGRRRLRDAAGDQRRRLELHARRRQHLVKLPA